MIYTHILLIKIKTTIRLELFDVKIDLMSFNNNILQVLKVSQVWG